MHGSNVDDLLFYSNKVSVADNNDGTELTCYASNQNVTINASLNNGNCIGKNIPKARATNKERMESETFVDV